MGREAHDIAMHDPAYAALTGDLGSDMGSEYSASYGADLEPDQFEGVDFGVGFGDEDGYDLDDEGVASIFGQAPAPPLPPAAVHKIVHHHLRRNHLRERRLMLLEPNKGSELKVERYAFGITITITALGTSQSLSGSNSPDVNFRPQRVTANVPSPGFIVITDGRVANVSFTVGGTIDAWMWNANAVGESLDIPTLTPANKASVSGTYTGLVPLPFTGTGSFLFCLSFSGPASIVA